MERLLDVYSRLDTPKGVLCCDTRCSSNEKISMARRKERMPISFRALEVPSCPGYVVAQAGERVTTSIDVPTESRIHKISTGDMKGRETSKSPPKPDSSTSLVCDVTLAQVTHACVCTSPVLPGASLSTE